MEKVVMTVTTLQKVITKKPCTKETLMINDTYIILIDKLNFVEVVMEKSLAFATKLQCHHFLAAP